VSAKPPNGLPSVVETLRTTPLFSAFGDADLAVVTHLCHLKALEPEEILFREGEACGAVYCLVSGLVKLYVSGPDHHEKVVEFVDPGRTFAEAAMFSGQGYPVNARALDDSLVVAIDAFSLMRYLREHSELAWQMLAVMSRRLHYLVGQIRSLSLHNSEQRLAAYLLDNYDPGEPDRPVARIPARRSELASMLGLTTETLCRGVAKFRREGWIETVDHDIVVHDPEALRGLVNRPRRDTS
jgi:CRP-like cAMP-binding protein